MLEPKAEAADTPPSTAQRAEITSPPTWENGSTSEAASRAMRPHMNTGDFLKASCGSTTHQARPRGTNSATWAATTAAKPPQPIGATAASTLPALK